VRYIDIQDSEEVLRALRLTADDIPIDIVLHTPGGLALAAELIALAADEIVMDPDAVLGSLDPQLGQHPAASIVRAVEWKTERHQEVDDETVILADVARKDRADARVRAQRPDAAPRLREGRGAGDHLQARRVDVRPPPRGRGAAAAPLPYRSPGPPRPACSAHVATPFFCELRNVPRSGRLPDRVARTSRRAMMDGRRPRSVGLTAVTFPRLWLLAAGCDADGSCRPRRPR